MNKRRRCDEFAAFYYLNSLLVVLLEFKKSPSNIRWDIARQSSPIFFTLWSNSDTCVMWNLNNNLILFDCYHPIRKVFHLAAFRNLPQEPPNLLCRMHTYFLTRPRLPDSVAALTRILGHTKKSIGIEFFVNTPRTSLHNMPPMNTTI